MGKPLPVNVIAARLAGNAGAEDWPSNPTRHELVRYILSRGTERLTMRDVAQRGGLNATTVQRILDGVTFPNFETGLKVSKGLGISPWTFLEYVKRVRRLAQRLYHHPPRDWSVF